MITHFVYGQKVLGCSNSFSPYLYTGEIYDVNSDGIFTIITEDGVYRYASVDNIFYDKTEACIRVTEIITRTINSHYASLRWFVNRKKSGKHNLNFLSNVKSLLDAIERNKIDWDNLKEQYGELLPTFEELRE